MLKYIVSGEKPIDTNSDMADDNIRARLKKSFGYDNQTIDELLAQVDAEDLMNQ